MEPVNKHKRTMHLLFGKQRPGRGENAEKMRKNADRFYFPPHARSWLHFATSLLSIMDPNTKSDPSLGLEPGLGLGQGLGPESPSWWNQSWFYNPL